MRIRLTSLLLLPLLPLMLLSCNNEPVFPIIPKIKFLDIQPKRVQALDLNNPITITFEFQDGDGNLGAADSTDNNLHLVDSRINSGLPANRAISKYSIPNLTPDAKNPSIKGEITVNLSFTAVVDPLAQEEQVRFQIKLWDRAGNLATPLDENPDNVVYTDWITVYR